LVNLILGEELLPCSALSTKSTICELKYGEQPRIVAHFKDKDPETGLPIKAFRLGAASSAQYHLQQIFSYVYATDERHKGSLYKKIELFWPHRLLKVFIIDVAVNTIDHSTVRGNGRWLGGEVGGEGLETYQGFM